jgi:hypothetical protein
MQVPSLLMAAAYQVKVLFARMVHIAQRDEGLSA